MGCLPTDLRAEVDPRLTAVLGPPFPLLYASGASTEDDHPGFVRAASAVVHWRNKRVVVQDDVNALAIGGTAAEDALRPLLLPRAADGRRRFEDDLGNKQLKLDLEAAVVLPDGRLLALGSGSSAARERFVLVAPDGGVRVHDAHPLYAYLRSQTAFAGSELNLEGALVSADTLELFQRGNGASSGSLHPVNAVGSLPLPEFLRWLADAGPVPRLSRIVRVDLGMLDGVRFGFTDATWLKADSLAILACAESSPDATQDGPVGGVRFGVLCAGRARVTDIVDTQGRRCRCKLEGIAPHRSIKGSFDVVADVDRTDQPAWGAVLRVSEGR
jgi:uncharacterized protein DUF6929